MPEKDGIDKVQELFQKILELWGEEIFDYLIKEAKKSDTVIDDFLVEKLKDWLL